MCLRVLFRPFIAFLGTLGSAALLGACGGGVGGGVGGGGAGGGSGDDGGAPGTSAAYTVSGEAVGLPTGAAVVLLKNEREELMLTGEGTFSFSTALPEGAEYLVTIKSQPKGLSCSVLNGKGRVSKGSGNSVRVLCTASPSECKNCFTKRYVYFAANITRAAPDKDADFKALAELIPRAAAAGYNGIMFAAAGTGGYDYMLVKPSKYYYENFAAIVKLAQESGVELIPTGLNPSGVTMIDPSLIEALPVVDTPFVAAAGSARAQGATVLTNAEFDRGLSGWSVDKSSVSLDPKVSFGAGGAIKLDQAAQKKASPQFSRLMRVISGLTPHRAYRLSFRIKTSNYNSPLRAAIYDKSSTEPVFLNVHNNPLGWSTVGGHWTAKPNTVATTQDWTAYNLDFNTAHHHTVTLLIGSWSAGASEGAAWIDDVQITEIGLAHTIVRPGLEVDVKSGDGAVRYVPDTDYVLEPEALKIPTGSRISPGATLKVSWYQSARYMESQYNTPASACSKRFFDITREVARKTDALLRQPKGQFMYYDEWRIMNWDPTCGPVDASTYLKNTTRAVQDILLSINPNYELYIWNDMFDPHQNAVERYWLVNGSLTGAWEGLHPRTIVMNWNNVSGGAKQVDSLKFFAGRGHAQMLALYYDDPSLKSVQTWMDNLVKAEREGVSGVNGFMFTTWRGNYNDLEKVADLLKTHYPQYWPQ